MRIASYGRQMRRAARKTSIGHVFDLDFRQNSFSYVLIPLSIAQLLLYMSTARDNIFPIGVFLVSMVLVGKYTNNALYKLGIPVLLSFVMVRYDILKQNFWEGMTEDADENADEDADGDDADDDADDADKDGKGKRKEKAEKAEKGRKDRKDDEDEDEDNDDAEGAGSAASAVLAELKKHQKGLADDDDDDRKADAADDDAEAKAKRDGFSNRVARDFASDSKRVSNPTTEELNSEIDALDTTLGRIERSYDRIMNFGSKLGIEKQLSGLTKSLDITGILNQQTKL